MNTEELFFKHKPLIEKVANKHRGKIKGLPTYYYEDIFQMASIGFIEACNSYDKEKGIPFQAYASKMMHWRINNTLRNKKSMMKFPYYFEEVWNLATKHHITYNVDEMEKLASLSNYTYEQVEKAMRWYLYNTPAYLDYNVEDGADMHEKVAGTEFDETGAVVAEYLSSLTAKQKQVVTLLMDGHTQSEIGRKLGVSQQHVSRIVKSLQKAWLDKYE